jgi:diadenosine tetraphosphate (Ap4A) HIT family hydrolase
VSDACQLCAPADVFLDHPLAYARWDDNALSNGHLIVVPKRHVADFFDMTAEEQAAVWGLLVRAQALVRDAHAPDGWNIGVNVVGKAAGQNRMHVHVHLIPRYTGDVADPRGGIRCVLAGRS